MPHRTCAQQSAVCRLPYNLMSTSAVTLVWGTRLMRCTTFSLDTGTSTLALTELPNVPSI